ncbi:hypothetical protein KW794_01795 [Candidatus Saccharibacteria bacterium]|nr:hypothetical protein [Candidatus Saccharibacteria bacterium]
MPLRQKVTGACAALGIALLVAGCGGSQDPLRTADAAPPFFDGSWDGFWFIPLFFWRLTGNVYGLYAVSTTPAYWFGYLVGVAVFVIIITPLARWVGFGAFLLGVAVGYIVMAIINATN